MIKHYLHKDLVGQKIEVHLVGAGGNGSQVLTGLARMHLALRALGHPGLGVEVFDPDRVTEANLGRQLFSPADVGQYKANVLVHRLNCFFGLDWEARPGMYSNRQHIDLVIGCVDSIASRRKIHQAGSCHYWLDLGNRARTGQVILGAPPAKDNRLDETRPRTFFELNPELNRGQIREDQDTPSCSLAEALEKQDLFINQTVATFGLQLLWSFLHQGYTTLNGYFINLESGRVTPMPIAPHNIGKPLAEVFTPKSKRKRI